MPAFPAYDAALIAALDAQADAILDLFARHGYARVEPPILQPADVFLDRSGEEMRRRTFALTDVLGRELCLRPDLTIPVARAHLAAHGKFPARLCYHGPVFRIQPAEPERPTQFLQAGVECLGAPNRQAADVEVLSLAVEALHAAGLEDFSVKLGDLGLFVGLVDALGIPPLWRARLTRHFWRPGYFRALLERASSAGRHAPFGAAGEAETRVALDALLDRMGGATLGGRTREEIAGRLLEKAGEAAALGFDKKAVVLIDRVLSVSGPAAKSVDAIAGLLKRAGIALDAPLAAMEKRIAVLEKLGVKPARTSFAANFGRNFEYYTGFVFELWSRDAEGKVQVAGGGRYDTLLQSLGARKPHPAVGCAIRTERVLAARRATRRS